MTGPPFGQMQSVELLIRRAAAPKFVVRADVFHRAFRKNDNHVCLAHGRETVSDDEARAARHQVFEGRLNQPLAFVIEIAGGFIKNQNFGIMHDGAAMPRR